MYWLLEYRPAQKEIVDYDAGISKFHDPAELLSYYETLLLLWEMNPSSAMDDIIAENDNFLDLNEAYDERVESLERYLLWKKRRAGKSKRLKASEDGTVTWLKGRADLLWSSSGQS